MKLPVRDVPLVGLVSRLVFQKGIDLIVDILPRLFDLDVQMVALGNGDPSYQLLLAELRERYPGKLAVRFAFDEGLAHRIEAGADLFLMPSRFEPCGLNQMYSLRYGTVPLVRAVGGLEDTVEDYDGSSRGTGFKFKEYHPRALFEALRRALDVFQDRVAWLGLIRRGMAVDLSWDRSAIGYETLYRHLVG